jgi:hypothetical protein
MRSEPDEEKLNPPGGATAATVAVLPFWSVITYVVVVPLMELVIPAAIRKLLLKIGPIPTALWHY